MPPPLLEVQHLSKSFPVKKGAIFRRTFGKIHAVSDVSFRIESNETVGLVGESGSGKTTIGRIVAGLTDPSSGSVLFEGKDISKMTKSEVINFRQRIGIVFQDPLASLNPRMRIAQVISEPLDIAQKGSKEDRQRRVEELLSLVGLAKNDATKRPNQFSGGQLQRIAIARALALGPSLIVADEPVSSLDVSIQAKILNLMRDVQKEFGLAFLLISHDLGAVRHVTDRAIVLYLGFVMEQSRTDDLFSSARHPYTKALLSAVLVPDVEKLKKSPPTLLRGEIPSPINLPAGCKFNTRCPYVQDRCRVEEPQLEKVLTPEHLVSCFYWNELSA
ncbi:MAG TPA: ABC transporter ATP-binding protein [Nitrososphaerales archaeon]